MRYPTATPTKAIGRFHACMKKHRRAALIRRTKWLRHCGRAIPYRCRGTTGDFPQRETILATGLLRKPLPENLAAAKRRLGLPQQHQVWTGGGNPACIWLANNSPCLDQGVPAVPNAAVMLS